MVRIISSILLMGFLGFLVPINNWHVLAHTHHTEKHPTDHSKDLTFKQGIEKCAFCDLQLPLLFKGTGSLILVIKAPFDFLFRDYTCCELPVKNTHRSLRGPPLNEFA